MFRKIGLTISYFIAGVYVFCILDPAFYCWQHGCHGPELDGFMPAFFLTPIGAIASVFCLYHSVQNIRRKSRPWLFWPLALLFGLVLAGVAALIASFVIYIAKRR